MNAQDVKHAARLFARGLSRFQVVNMFTTRELRQRYRRSTLGPFWVTVSMAVWIGTLAFVLGRVFDADTNKLLPFISVSIILWTFLATSLNEACMAYASNEDYIKTINLPITIYVYRVAWANAIIAAHNFIVYIAVAILFSFIWDVRFLDAILGLSLFVLNCLWMMFILALLCVRFRDTQSVVASVLQVMFYLTPIIWMPSYVTVHKRLFIDFNPLYYLFEVARAPLLGQPLSSTAVIVTIIAAMLGWTLTLLLYARWAKRIPFWV